MRRTELKSLSRLLCAIAALASAEAAWCDDRFAAGARVNVVTAGGEPANDILSFGIFGKVRLSADWLVGAAVDKAEYDFELPWRVVGIEQSDAVEPIDALVESTIITAWLEREFGGAASANRFFLTGGAGLASPEVGRVQGPVEGGGIFDLETDAGTEILITASAGVRRNLGDHFALEFALRADHHISEWDVVDRPTGRTGQTGDYTGLGGHLAVLLRF